MAHYTEQAGFPPLPLNPGMVLKLEARSQAADTEVSGATSSRWAIYGFDSSGVGGDIGDVIPDWVAEG